MRFPRNARVFRGQLDAAPFAAVFFLLVIFVMLGSFIYTPGVRLQLPTANDLPGTDKPTVSVAVDKGGRLYYDNQWIEEKDLSDRLRAKATGQPAPLTLLLHADKDASYEMCIHVALLARDAGIPEALLVTLPRPLAGEPAPTPP